MISFLKGTLVEALPTRVEMDVNGVGYEVLIPVSSFDKLPQPGGDLKILTHLVVREDAHVLYGFATEEERELFRLLIHAVSGVGPRLALSILSGMTPGIFKTAIAGRDVKAISSISGIGKKTAERIVVELKDKVGETIHHDSTPGVPVGTADVTTDAVNALIALQIKPAEALKAVKAAQAMLGADASVEALVKASLKR